MVCIEGLLLTLAKISMSTLLGFGGGFKAMFSQSTRVREIFPILSSVDLPQAWSAGSSYLTVSNDQPKLGYSQEIPN